MSPHLPEQAGTFERYGPFARMFCMVEIITWFQHRASIKAVVVDLVKAGHRPGVFPKTVEEIHALLDGNVWIKVGRAVGDDQPQKLLLMACEGLAKVKPCRWAPSDDAQPELFVLYQDLGLDVNEDAFKAVLQSGNTDNFAEPSTVGTIGRISLSILCNLEECGAEAKMIVERTDQYFADEISSKVISGNQDSDTLLVKESTFCVVLLSSKILMDKHCLELVGMARDSHVTLIPVLVERIGLVPFDFTAPTLSSVSDRAKSSFETLKKTLAKPFNPHSATEQVQVQLKALWGDMGLVSGGASNKYQALPKVPQPYDVVLRKASEYAVGTREWVFDQIKSWINNDLVETKSSQRVASVGLGNDSDDLSEQSGSVFLSFSFHSK
jgi:hypothetical protein